MAVLNFKNPQKNFQVYYYFDHDDHVSKADLARKVNIDYTNVLRMERCFKGNDNCAYKLYKILADFYFQIKSKLNEEELKNLIFKIPADDFKYIIKLYANEYMSPRYFYDNKNIIKKIVKEYNELLKKIIPDIDNRLDKLFNIKSKRKEKYLKNKKIKKNDVELKYLNKKFIPKKVNIISFGDDRSEVIQKLKNFYDEKYKKELENA